MLVKNFLYLFLLATRGRYKHCALLMPFNVDQRFLKWWFQEWRWFLRISRKHTNSGNNLTDMVLVAGTLENQISSPPYQIVEKHRFKLSFQFYCYVKTKTFQLLKTNSNVAKCIGYILSMYF